MALQKYSKKSAYKAQVNKKTKSSAVNKRKVLNSPSARSKKFNTKKLYKKPRAKKLTNAQLQALRVSRPASVPLNIDFYSAAEGTYNSYWLGKFINSVLSDGKKKTVAKHVYKAFSQIKFATGTNPLILFLEVLDKIKPSFRLRNYIVRRVIVKEFPIAVLRPRRLIMAVHWLKEEVQSSSGKFATSLDSEIASKLLDFRLNPKKNNLAKKRNEFTKRTIKAQFNIRYNFR